MPRSEELNTRMREESSARILQAALLTFASHGFGGASIRRIAEEAGVSPGLIYAYYPSKEALLRALFEQSVADVRASFAAADAEKDPRRRVERLVRASFAIVREKQDFWRLSYGIRMQAAALPDLQEGIRAWQEEILKTLAHYLKSARIANPALEARILFAEIDGIAQHFVLDPDHYPLESVIDRLCAKYG